MQHSIFAEKLLENMILSNKSELIVKLSKAIHGELYALQIVAMHDSNITPGDISREAGISPARIAAELNSLENKGFITRKIDPGNRRRILVCLTPEGVKSAAEHHREALEAANMLLEQLGEQDSREYIRIIGKLGDMQSNQKSST